MRFLEIRRHTMRAKPGQHLNQFGVTLARRLGESVGPFARVLSSTVPRALETAVAMGFAVDEQIELISTSGDAVEREIAWPASFADYAKAIAKGRATADYARQLNALWHEIASGLPDGASALIITHGGIPEIGAVAAFPNANHTEWGGSCGFCEGVRLHFDGDAFVKVDILRVKQE